MAKIPIQFQFFVERWRNNLHSWGMLVAMLGLLGLYGLIVHWAPRFLRKNKDRYLRLHRWHSKLLRLWSRVNRTYRLRMKYFGTFYVQTSVLTLFSIYVGFLILLSCIGTADINYEPRSYIIGKKIGKVSVGNWPLLFLFVTKNDVLTVITGWPAHHLTLLHIWMGRVVYSMIIIHIILTAHYWLSIDFSIMIWIPPQIIGMIAFGSMTLLTLLSTGFIRRLSYEFFLFNHVFLGVLAMLGSFLHNDGGKVAIALAVHTLALDRMVLQVRSFINNWCMKPEKCMGTYTVLDPVTIKITIPVSQKSLKLGGKVLKTYGKWAPGQHIYIKVPSVGRFEWHPYTVANTDETGEMLIIMKVYRGFTKRLLKAINKKCDELGTESCQLKTWFHGAYGSTVSPLTDFDSALFVSGGTGASFTLPVALDLMREIAENNSGYNCKRAKFVWYTRSRESLLWYESGLATMRELIKVAPPGMISLEIYLTGKVSSMAAGDVEAGTGGEIAIEMESLDKAPLLLPEGAAASDSLMNIETKKPKVYDIVEKEISEQCKDSEDFDMRNIAVLSCGPAAIVNETAFEAERQERIHQNLSVYRYLEKYVV